jgi:hypothetical protein
MQYMLLTCFQFTVTVRILVILEISDVMTLHMTWPT